MALIPSFSPAITFFFCGLLLFCLGSFLPARFRRYKHKLHSGSKPRTIWDLEIAKKILNGSWSDIAANIHDKPPSLLEARARSNVRLKHAFHIDNSFTTTDAKYHMEFRKLAVQLVSLKGDQWVRLAERAQEAVDRTLSHLQSSQDDFFRVPLVPLIQASVLGTVLSMLYPQHWNRQVSPKEQHSALLTVSELIDTLWIASKSSTTSSFKNSEPTAAFQDLQAALRLLLPGMPCSSGSAKDNPLNLLLPSYETLWRLVLMCLLEIRFRRSPEIQRKTQRMQLQLKSLLKDTGDQNFKFANKTTGVSGSDIINEALRLYPPTKRIYRQLQPLGDVEVDEVAIDIEHLHRDAEIWGEDAQLFRPERWRHVSNIQLQSFIPFGAGKSVCPAKVSFGPKAAAILTAALLEKITGDWELVSTGGDENIAVLNSDAVLTNERGAYKNLYLLYRSD